MRLPHGLRALLVAGEEDMTRVVGTFTDFFVAEPGELRRAFVGWRRPAPTPEKRSILNPFTRQTQDTLTWVADRGDTERVEPFAGATLGQRLAQLAHLQLKNLDPLMLSELMALVIGGDSSEWLTRIGNPPPLVNVEDHQTEHLFFWELPEPFVDALAKFGPGESAEVGRRWAEGIEADWTAEDCADVVRDLGALAKRAREAGKRVYYWV